MICLRLGPKCIKVFILLLALDVTFTYLYIHRYFASLYNRNTTSYKTIDALLDVYPMNVDLREVVENYKSGKNELKTINEFKYRIIKAPSRDSIKQDRIIIFIVKSAIGNFKRRDSIRRTWAMSRTTSGGEQEHLNFNTIFFVGKSKNRTDEEELLLELNEYNDIVQMDFYDHYYNNTLKTTGAINWVKEFCSNVQFAMFVDDDFFVFTDRIMNYVRSLDNNTMRYFFTGNVLHNAPNRDVNNKWYISRKEYGFDMYPPYVRAGAWIASKSFIEDLSIAIKFTKRFKLDDVFISIVAYKLHVKPLHDARFAINKVSYYHVPFKYILASHGYGDRTEMSRAWTCASSIPPPLYPWYCSLSLIQHFYADNAGILWLL